jgi:hypothetical protein
MSNLNLPQSEAPMANHEYFWYEVTELEYGEDPTRVESVIALQHNNDNGLVREWRFDRNILINRIRAGDRFMYNGERLTLIKIDGIEVIRAGNGPQVEKGF